MSLAVKYRPRDFESMVGQTFVKETLQEAVKEDKLVGAYLFCGPRGTGKTSVARILAKTINCLSPKNGNPCHKCEICVSIADNKLMDIIEIDAASHTGVDNIRDIIEKAQFMPNIAKYKVYIIDEVHMLSTGAFNALLKILEEPPKHVKFILATTEIHKIPETILSRCQRYDFKNFSDIDLKSRLQYIAKEEKIKVDTDSIVFIVKNAHGGLRNAITLFEQYVINNEIIFENIVKNLGITESSFISDFFKKLINHDKSVVYDFDKIIENGKNIKLFFKDLIYHVRDTILENIKLGQSICELNQILEILDETYTKTKNSMDERITLLSGILKVVTRSENQKCRIEENVKIKIQDTKNEDKKNSHSEFISESIIHGNTTKQGIKDPEINSGGHPTVEKTKPELETYEVCDIEIDEAFDVFGYDNSSVVKTQEVSIKEVEISSIGQNSKIDFSIEDFIAKVKELGGKGSIILGLKGAKINFDGQKMDIKIPSKMALKSFQETGSKELLLEALTKMGFNDVKLKLE